MRTTLLVLTTFVAASSASAAIDDQRRPRAEPEEPPRAPVLTKAPELLELSSAAYPDELLAEELAGEAIVFVDIDVQGEVERVVLHTATHPAFGAAAVAAATGLVFSPAEVDGAPSPIRIEYRYEFVPALPEPDAIAGAVTPQSTTLAPVNFSGLVREAGVRKPIAGAVIYLAGRPVAETDADGRFEVRGAPLGEVRVRVTSPMHDSYEVDEALGEGERTDVKYYLVRTVRNPFETVVLGRGERREVAKIQLDREELSKIPGTFGDPVRVIENLPGMARTPGGLGGALLVRGARPQDTAVYVDGVFVPLIFHFGGLTSIINSEFLERIDFFPGGFGARYGHATAGVVDVVSRELDCDLVRGSAEIDLVDSAAFVCAPAYGEWSVGVAARRSYIDLLLPFALDAALEEDDGALTIAPVYWDYQAKAHGNYGAHAFDIFAFGSDDRLSLIQSGSEENVNQDFGLHLSFHRLTLQHRYRPSDRLTVTSMLAPGYTVTEFSQTVAEVDADNGLRVPVWSLDWREDLSFRATSWLTVNGGIDHGLGRGRVSLTFPVPTELRTFESPTFDYANSQSYEAAVNDYSQGYWLEAALAPHPSLKLTPGLRFERFDFHKTQAYALMPRVSARWEILPGTTVKGAYGWYEKLPEPQFLLEGIGNPNLEPERAHHFVLGLEQAFTELITVDLQLFYNLRQKLRSPSPVVTYEDGRAVPEIWNNDGTGRSYGVELLLRHLATPEGRFFGWVSYTLSRSLQRDRQQDVTLAVQGSGDGGGLAEVDERAAQEYLVDYDQTHILTMVGQWILPWGLEAGFRFRLVSGNPYTPLDRGKVYWDADGDRYRVDLSEVRRNSGRMPTFDQLDVRIDKGFTFDLWRLWVYLEVLNVYNAKNVEAFQYDYRFRERQALTLLPIVPILGVRGEF